MANCPPAFNAFRASSLYCDGLRQIARLVDIGTLGAGNMIGKQLNGHRIDQRGDQRVDSGHFDCGEAPLTRFCNAFGVGYQHDLAASGADLLHVADCFFEQRTAWRENDNGNGLVD